MKVLVSGSRPVRFELGNDRSAPTVRHGAGGRVRGSLLFLGAMTALGALAAFGLFLLGVWEWQRWTEPVTSPSGRFTVSQVVYQFSEEFGLVMTDHDSGTEAIVAGWARSSAWCESIHWTSDHRLTIEYREQNSLGWARKTEQFGVAIDWVPVEEIDD